MSGFYDLALDAGFRDQEAEHVARESEHHERERAEHYAAMEAAHWEQVAAEQRAAGARAHPGAAVPPHQGDAMSTTTIEPTRLDILLHASELAEELGAVKNGGYFFEDETGTPLYAEDLLRGTVSADRVCGVCVGGATTLARILLGQPVDVDGDMDAASRAAQVVLGDDPDVARPFTHAITVRGTPYVLAVLDQMVADERAAVGEPERVAVLA